MRMAEQQSSDTTYTKVFVGGLAWETHRDTLRQHFQQYGEILEAVVITDKTTGRSKGYGFVTFRDPEAARQACEDATPVIDGRRANCNLASLGAQHRSRTMLPFGQGNKQYRSMAPIPHQGGPVYMGAPVYFQQGNYGLQYGLPYQNYGFPYSPEIVYQPGMYNPYGGVQYPQVYSGPTMPASIRNSPMYTYLQVSQPPSPGYSMPIPQAMQYGATATTALAQQPYGFVPVSPTIQPTGAATLGSSTMGGI